MRRNEIESYIENLSAKKSDITVRTVSFGTGWIKICFIRQLIDSKSLMEYVIKPIVEYRQGIISKLSAQHFAESVIYADKYTVETDINKAEHEILNGHVVIFLSIDSSYISANIRNIPQRAVETPDMEYALRGARDSFVENIDTNLSLLRYRVKDPNLRVEITEVGERTKLTVGLVYIGDIVNPKLPDEVKKRIEEIQTDGIFESGELQNYLLNNQGNLFPQMGTVMRSDMAAELLFEGKVVILVDGSPLALTAPKVFAEFMYSCDDRYENKHYGLFMRFLRYAGLIISVTLTSLYIAIAYYSPDVMPPNFIIQLAMAREKAPLNPFLAVVTVEFIVELMREALIRVPQKVGSAIAIVGAIIIGQAASTSGVFTPQLLIFVSVAFLASFTIPDVSFTNAFRIIKFLIIFMTGFFGFYGFSAALVLVLVNLVSINSFGVPYTAPFAPFNLYDFVRAFIFGRKTSPKRQQYMRNNDDTRAPGANQNTDKK